MYRYEDEVDNLQPIGRKRNETGRMDDVNVP